MDLEPGKIIESEQRGSRPLRAVSKEIGISTSTLSRVECGVAPDIFSLVRICEWLEVSVDGIFELNRERKSDIRIKQAVRSLRSALLALEGAA